MLLHFVHTRVRGPARGYLHLDRVCVDLDLFLDKPSPSFVQTFGETRIFLIGHTCVLAQVGRRVARFMHICCKLHVLTRFVHMKHLFVCFMCPITRVHMCFAQEIGVFNTKQVSYVRMRPRGRVTKVAKLEQAWLGGATTAQLDGTTAHLDQN